MDHAARNSDHFAASDRHTTMTTSDAEKLVLFVRSLPGFVFYSTIDGNYQHIGATVADAVLQANNR